MCSLALNEPQARSEGYTNLPIMCNFIAYREVALVAKMNGEKRRP